MKQNNHKESEALKVYHQYWDSYIKGDIDGFSSTLDDDFEMIGTSESEVCHNKTEGIEFFKSQVHEIVGRTEMRNRNINTKEVNGMFLINETCDVYIFGEPEWTFYSKLRLSTLLQGTESGWKIFQQHGSLPDIRVQEGETIAFDKISKENLQLRDAVRRRTAELENKNRELAIEASLDKVRAVAMGMKNPKDMLDVCRVIAVQLEGFGVAKIRNVQTVIIDEQIGQYLCYQFFPAYGQTIIEDTEYQKSPVEHEMVKQMLSSRDGHFTGSLSGRELEEFCLHRKEVNHFPDPLLDAVSEISYCFLSIGEGGLGLSLYQAMEAEVLALFKRFHQVFSLAYQLFRDIQKAEARAREAQIEAAVERVRAQSMAMHHPDDIDKVNKEILSQLNWLQLEGLTGVTLYLIDENGWVKAWDFSNPGNLANQSSYTLEFDSNKHEMLGFPFQTLIQTDLDYFVADYPLEKLEKAVYEFEEIDPAMAKIIREALSTGVLTHQWTACCRISNGLLGIDMISPPSEDTKTLLQKIAGAFNQAYQRFLDLQKAEAQAREAQIEVALERTRTQNMLMQHSDEIKSISTAFHEQLLLLGIPSEFSYVWLPDEASQSHQFWASWSEKYEGGTILQSKQVTYPLDKTEPYTAACYAAWAHPDLILEEFIPPSDIAGFFEVWQELLAGATKLKADFFPEGIYYSEAYMRYGCFGINIRRKLSEEEKNILKRFSIEFERAYTRFLDLQKAESHAREAQIQLALERVRARTMSMQKSDELGEVSYLLNKQVVELGIPTRGCAFNIYGEHDSTEWFSNLEGTIPAYQTPREYIFLKYYEAGQRGESLLIEEFSGERIKDLYKYFTTLNGSGNEKVTDHIAKAPDFQINHMAYFKYGYLLFITLVPAPEAHDVFKRFAKEFEQTYTRFLDLQKAEAQAREAQIEAALERVRAKAMSMHQSDELNEVLEVLCAQFDFLGINPMSTHITLLDIEHNKFTFRETGKFGNRSFGEQTVALDAMDTWKDMVESWKNADPYSINRLHFPKETLPQVWEVFHASFASMPEGSKITPDDYPDGIFHTAGKHPFGYIGMNQVRKATEEEELIVLKFANEFGRAYQRFLDLQKAEEQAREAQIEAALEKVRSRTMAMQKSDELADAAYVLFEQLNILGVTHERINIGIVDEANQQIDFWVTEQGGQKLQTKFSGRISEPTTLSKSYEAWKKGAKSLVVDLRGKDLQSWLRFMEEEIKIPFNKIYLHNRRVQTAGFFSKGMLVVTSPEPLQDEGVYLLEKFAKVFDLTYTRFNDLLLAEAQAKEAQIELSLEKIRAQVASMQESTDLLDIMVNIRGEFVALGHEAHYFWYMRWLHEKYEKAMTSGDGTQVGMIMTLPRHIHGDIPLVANWERGAEPTLVFPMEVDTAVAYSKPPKRQPWMTQLDLRDPTGKTRIGSLCRSRPQTYRKASPLNPNSSNRDQEPAEFCE
jgi:hypothetical protein